MTGYTVHTGSSDKFSQGWDGIFGGAKGKQKPKAAASKQAKKSKAKAKKRK